MYKFETIFGKGQDCTQTARIGSIVLSFQNVGRPSQIECLSCSYGVGLCLHKIETDIGLTVACTEISMGAMFFLQSKDHI